MIASHQSRSKAGLSKPSSPIWSSCVTRSSARNRWCVSWRARLAPQRETRANASLAIRPICTTPHHEREQLSGRLRIAAVEDADDVAHGAGPKTQRQNVECRKKPEVRITNEPENCSWINRSKQSKQRPKNLDGGSITLLNHQESESFDWPLRTGPLHPPLSLLAPSQTNL